MSTKANEMSIDKKQETCSILAEREAFEAWVVTLPGHPFAGIVTTMMRQAWQARAALEAKPAPAQQVPRPPFTFEERNAVEKWVAAAPAGPAEPVGFVFAGEIITYTGDGQSMFAPFNAPKWVDGFQPSVGTKLYRAAPAAPAPLTDAELDRHIPYLFIDRSDSERALIRETMRAAIAASKQQKDDV